MDYDDDYDEDCRGFKDAGEDERRDFEERNRAFGCPRGTFQKFSFLSEDGGVDYSASKGTEGGMGGRGKEFEAREGFPGGGGGGTGGRGRGCGCGYGYGCESCRRDDCRGGEQGEVGSCGDRFEIDADGNVLLECRHHRGPSVPGQGNLAEGSTLLSPAVTDCSVGRGELDGGGEIHLVPAAEAVKAQQNFRDTGGRGETRLHKNGEDFDMMFGRLAKMGGDVDYDYDKSQAHEGRVTSPLANDRAGGSENVLQIGASGMEGMELEAHIRKFVTGSGQVVIGGKTIRLDSDGFDAEEDGDDYLDYDDDYVECDDCCDDYDDRDIALPTRRPRVIPAGTPARKPRTMSAEFPAGACRDDPPSSENFPRNSCYDSDDGYCCGCGGGGRGDGCGSEGVHPSTRQQQQQQQQERHQGEYSCSAHGDERGNTHSGVDDWPPPWAGVEYGDSVEEQVVLLEGLGAFVTPPGWEGRLGTGELARAADPAEVRRRCVIDIQW